MLKIILGAAALVLSSVALAASIEIVGNVIGQKGNTATLNRVLLKDSPIYNGDEVRTGAHSYLVIKFIDGSKMTVRPSTILSIDKYQYNRNGNDAVAMQLFKGALRVVTGEVAKNKPSSYKIKTPVATLGVRGTEFYIQICKDEENCNVN